MPGHLTVDEVRLRLAKLAHDLPRADCWNCECLQVFLTQLEMDAADDVGALIARLRVRPEGIHSCLGCDPCPSGSLFARYFPCDKAAAQATI